MLRCDFEDRNRSSVPCQNCGILEPFRPGLPPRTVKRNPRCRFITQFSNIPIDLDPQAVLKKGGGGDAAGFFVDSNQNGSKLEVDTNEKMSICLESSAVLAKQVSTIPVLQSPGESGPAASSAAATPTPQTTAVVVAAAATTTEHAEPSLQQTQQQQQTQQIMQQQVAPQVRTIAKLPATAGAAALSKASLITVLNTPLGNVKTLCVTPAVSSNASGQFTVVNSAAPLNAANATVKPQTITLINTPVTVVKTISPGGVLDKVPPDLQNSGGLVGAAMPALIENRGHNVFVKNTAPEAAVGQDVPQGHKLLTANNFPGNNVLATAINMADMAAQKTANGQRNKVKILSNVCIPGPSQTPTNILLNKTAASSPAPQRYLPRQKLLGPPNNGTAPTTTKYLNKPPNNLIMNKSNINPMANKQPPPQKIMYPTHKSQIKTLPPVNNYMHQKPPGIKTLPPQHPKGIPGGQVQRTGSGLRTIPPQRPQKVANKPNYIGKHAVQAQKSKPPHKMKTMKPNQMNQMYNSYHNPGAPLMQEKQQLTFNQALTAEILETLGNKSSAVGNSYPKNYEILPPRYDSAYYTPEVKPAYVEQSKPVEERSKSGLDALSLICQAVLLDHNYNATPPPDSPTRSIPTPNTPTQMNGVSVGTMYSPGSGKRRTLSASNPVSAATSLSSLSVTPTNSTSMIGIQDDDAASDISDGSDRKHDTEGEETDTAPEAEANNEDQFGDYVTRCICGFLHDDGYMIECDRCKVWQHVQCVVKNRLVPDQYWCEVCDPHKHIDRHKARMVQQQWLRGRQFTDTKPRKDTKLREVFKHKDSTMSDTDTSDGEHTGPNNNIVGKGRHTLVNRRKSDSHQKANNARQRRDSAKEAVQRRQVKKRDRKVVKRKTKAQLKIHHSDEEPHEVASSTHLPQLRQWIENYEEAVTNHYSPELRARIGAIRVNGAHSDFSAVCGDPSVNKCRVHTQPLTDIKYLVSTVHLPPNTPVIELRGKYMLSIQHKNPGGGNLNTRQHTQRPGPFLFFYRLHRDNTEVCVDTRTYGNCARFVRRSCRPNAELRHSIVKGVLHLYIVTIADVDRNVELTIKHESHDLAAIGTTHISCACGSNEECTVNRTTIKKNNGDATEMSKKRRGRRTTSLSSPTEPEPPQLPGKCKKEPPSPLPSPVPPIKTEEVDIKPEPEEEAKEIEEKPVKEEIKAEPEPVEPEEKPDVKPAVKVKEEEEEEEVKEEVKPESPPPPPPPPITTRRSSSHHKVEKEEIKEPEVKEESLSPTDNKNKNKKLSREERKLEAILRAIAQMEKADQRKQEHQAKQAHRRESEPGPGKEEEKVETKIKRKRRKGRARTTSTTQSNRRNRVNSTDSYLTSGDETLLSPHDNPPPNRPAKDLSDYRENSMSDTHNSSDKDVGLLLALSNGDNKSNNNKSPARDTNSNSNSNSANSSPETHLSSACLLVQAAVEPMEAGFKFPKTKKGLMNEWLNKVPDPVQSASSISPSSLTPHISPGTDYESNVGFYTPGKSLVALAQVASFCDNNLQPRGNAKKRWLRQAISEDQCDSPSGRPESPPLSDAVAPPKKRRLPRESLSNDNTPPTTPTGLAPSLNNNDRQSVQEGCVEIIYSGADDDSPTQALESDSVLEERVAEMKEEFSKCLVQPQQEPPVRPTDMPGVSCLMDPRLSRDHHHHHHHPLFSNSEHLVGTVEKTLSILGFEDRKPEPITPAKRKLSITEYRQRKKLNNNDRTIEEPVSTEENTSESFKPMRPRSDSTSSCTSLTSSDDEAPLELTGKAPSAFNSEPTELERQREMTSLRLKKAFGIAVDEESRKPALDVEAILNCEISPVVKAIPPSPNFPIPGSCDMNLSKPPMEGAVVPVVNPLPLVHRSPPVLMGGEPLPQDEAAILKSCRPEVEDGRPPAVCGSRLVKPTMFYTPDEEERGAIGGGGVVEAPTGYEEVESVDYVPPFNNPIYPNDSNFAPYSSVIDEEGRYEGRNPSPPPDLEPPSADDNAPPPPFAGHQT